jgi:predicted amino acid racemase
VLEVISLPGICLAGLGTNLSCYGGVVPSEDNMQQLVDYATQLERTFGLHLPYISGGNSSALPLIAAGKMPRRVNHMRIGEGILLGRETIHRTAWPDTFQDAFCLYAEVIELKEKPSVPIGDVSEDAFGRQPTFADHGERVRAILDIGREDVDVTGLQPLDARLTILGASSDHLLVDVTAAAGAIRVGDDLAFALNYSALLMVMTSPYVAKRPLHACNCSAPMPASESPHRMPYAHTTHV